ncbi:hypothetical protein [Oryza sativa Japonica Group]|uniref:Uncharacterized protein n=1 Tax=Oryza sativa subsp. japonica TaxID=39947 RepID=Q5VQW8_ORYSJ|nr:hypothetical protein [Oryza sativa Japonica Group]
MQGSQIESGADTARLLPSFTLAAIIALASSAASVNLAAGWNINDTTNPYTDRDSKKKYKCQIYP